ncbi:S1C family serine protease [Kineosporia babensis]|uniref:S1C family serine protease n=1 Tax=Kineosporia babensis TaxID=499548 RepID=A0A9X1N8C0_9ACTN|nr:trypsin-like peptidase domain-containing protein [Kineosporia babensis]MCD5309383.1 S1C family serine protease [Kineosporia babensis]
MQPDALSVPRQQTGFCTGCGQPRVGQVCDNCGRAAPPSVVPPAVPVVRITEVAHKPRRGLRIGAGVIVFALLLGGIGLGAKNLTDQRATEQALDQATASNTELQRKLDSLSGSTATLTNQIASLQSKVDGQPDPAKVASKAQPSVFTVDTETGTGSAWVVSANADGSELITNYHVVKDTWRSGGRTVQIVRDDAEYTGTIDQVEQSADLAVVSVEEKLPVLPIAAKKPAVGDPVLVLGSPLGLGGTVTSGIVSAFRTEDGEREMQFSAPISPGNSGGPVINLRGEVIGVSVAKYVTEGAEGLGFAIPAATLCNVLHVC